MIARLLELRPFLDQLHEEEKLPSLSPETWTLLEEIRKGLEPFTRAQKLLEGEFYPTISLVAPTIVQLREDLLSNPCEYLIPVRQDFFARWGDRATQFRHYKTLQARQCIDRLRPIHLVATYLDHRFRFLSQFTIDEVAHIHDLVIQMLIETVEEISELPQDPTASRKRQLSIMNFFSAQSPNLLQIMPESQSDLPAHQVEAEAEFHEYQRCFVTRSRNLSLEVFNKMHEKEPADPLQWWLERACSFPIHARLAQRLLAIPATSAPMERLFSRAGQTITRERNRLKPNTANEVIFLRENWALFEEIVPKK